MLNTMRSTMVEGIAPGGGKAFLCCSAKLVNINVKHMMLKFLNKAVLLKCCRLFLNLFYMRGKYRMTQKGMIQFISLELAELL